MGYRRDSAATRIDASSKVRRMKRYSEEEKEAKRHRTKESRKKKCLSTKGTVGAGDDLDRGWAQRQRRESGEKGIGWRWRLPFGVCFCQRERAPWGARDIAGMICNAFSILAFLPPEHVTIFLARFATHHGKDFTVTKRAATTTQMWRHLGISAVLRCHQFI